MTGDLLDLARQERRDLFALLRTLDQDQWEAPTLCAKWSVHDVAAHVMAYDGLSTLGLVAALIRGRFSLARTNDLTLRAYTGCDPAHLLAVLARRLDPRGLTAAFGGAIALTDGLIHHQDIRRALGLPREVPPARLVPALDFALRSPALPSRRRTEGLRMVATDVSWAHGPTTGPRLDGPGEALLMAIAGRPAVYADLTGPGVAILAGRTR